MKYTSVIVLASTGLASALTQQCTGTAADEGGNWFCGAVEQILYEGFSGSGTYKAVTNMGSSGECTTEDVPYSGPLAPLDEDLSIHIRGPANIKQVAVYNLASEKKKRDVAPSPHVHARRHGHEHFHKQRKNKRAEWITATIDGKVVSWENNYFGPATAVAPVEAAVTEAAVSVPVVEAAASEPTTSTTSTAAAAKSSSKSKNKSSSSSSSSGSDWERTSYYNAEQQVTDNLVFLGNYGGEGSGVFDTVWGNSLSYLNANGDGGSDSPQILKDTLIPSNKEFAIFSGEKCDGTCGYSRAPDVAYKGFAGANKIFLFEFKMPLDGNRDFNGDMPAIWALNARIPRTAQYSSCSCWTSGCGEADIYEVLASGDTKCKSTFHLKNGAGSSDYFDRPTDAFIKVATYFDESTASVVIKQLSDDFDFSAGLSDATVQSWVSGFAESSAGSSLFQLSA
ncbi:putative TOS1-like glycosyl hydrolase-domain-containing protein [Dactylonectria estremocensis]|uniref:glucan endo-1,3-beta-D-glucosidase n=1 Tax=Dactylonectria estremocensis TaxID=1079267 RepID=A0A9P9F8V0_9HYPO|nr:putative TOS1-like glycosyl hydrolase-domain-containing protein [Dactylonectria estremocensis]